MESNKLNTRLSLVGALLGLTLFIMGGLLNTILESLYNNYPSCYYSN